MLVRGTAVKSIPEFVKSHFPDHFDKWIDSLPANSATIFSDLLYNDNWYSIHDALSIPINVVAGLFYKDNICETAWTMGAFSAEIALTGIYKAFMQLGNPKFIIKRAPDLMNLYFKPALLEIATISESSACFHIKEFEGSTIALEHNIGGWMQRALEIAGCINSNVSITRSLALQDSITEYLLSWEKTSIFNISALRHKKNLNEEKSVCITKPAQNNNSD